MPSPTLYPTGAVPVAAPGRCPLTGQVGTPRRRCEGGELAASYEVWHGQRVPPELVAKYFADPVQEYQSEESGLRWYEPARLGESDFYEWLARVFPWYYTQEAGWDKQTALECLEKGPTRRFLEVGCGNGGFLKLARSRGVAGFGTEINRTAIEDIRREGLEVYHAGEVPDHAPAADTLVSLQSLEHVHDPVGYLRAVLERFPVERMIIAVPAHDTLLGRTREPLAWPPHHYTAWSERALACLGRQLGYRLTEVRYGGLNYDLYRMMADKEDALGGRSELPRLPVGGKGWLGRAIFKGLRLAGVPWASRLHSILGVLVRDPAAG